MKRALVSLSITFLAAQASAIESQRLELLKNIVNINSSSDNPEGLERVRQKIVPEFESLGFKTQTKELTAGHKLVIFEMPDAKPEFLLLGHIDTVFSKNSSFQEFKVDGDHVQGPGVIDMKGGVVMMLDVLSSLSPQERAHFLVAINDDEEIGSPASKEPLDQLAKDLKAILIYEPGLPDRSVVTSLSGALWLDLTVHGKAAHAGLEHDKGYNACVELSHKLILLSRLTNYGRHLTVSPGVIEGGTKPNVVCEKASAKIDVRFLNENDRQSFLKKFEKIRDNFTVKNTRIDFKPHADSQIRVDIPPLTQRSTQHLYTQAKEAAQELHYSLPGVHVGYVTDGNHLATSQADILVGLGPYGGGIHTDGEFLSLKGYDERLLLNRLLLKKILSSKITR